MSRKHFTQAAVRCVACDVQACSDRLLDNRSAGYTHWPHVLWERIAFDGTCRWSDGTDVESEAAYVNARLPPHPGMPHLRSAFAPSIYPARREQLRQCTTAQVTELDTLGFTVLRSVITAAELRAVSEAVAQGLTAAESPAVSSQATCPCL